MILNIILRLIAVILLVMAVVHFMIPMGAGIVNIGNIAGVTVPVLLIFLIVFFELFKKMASRMWERTGGRIFLVSAGAVTVVCAVGAVVLSIAMLKAMNDKPDGKPVTLVVLGCQINGETPSRMLKSRLDTAYDYLVENENIKVIVSGGQGSDEVTSEADVMQKYLVNRGIPENRIYMEDKSTSTEENLEFSKAIIEKEGLCRDIAIVTDGFHQLRADIFAKKQELRAYNLPSKTEEWLLPTYWIREWFGIIHCLVFD